MLLSRFVRVRNPGSGPKTILRKIARKWERRGWARWLDLSTIERIECDQRSAVIERARIREIAYDRASRTGLASVQAIRNLPVAGPAERLLTERRRRAA